MANKIADSLIFPELIRRFGNSGYFERTEREQTLLKSKCISLNRGENCLVLRPNAPRR